MKANKLNLRDETILSKIQIIRGQKVMLDQDLAILYEVETKRLNEQVKRNMDRFPSDFMFQLTKEEYNDLKSQIATSSWGGRRVMPYVFSEHGVLMLSSVLKSKRAIEVNIHIMRIFIKMRELLMTQKDLVLKLEKLEHGVENQGYEIKVLFEYIKKLVKVNDQFKKKTFRKKIGFG